MPARDTPRSARGEWGLGRLLSMAARLVEQDWNALLASHAMTHAGLVALHHLSRGPSSQRDLAAACLIEEQTMSRVLDKLERSGFIARRRDPSDARRLLVSRTAAGTNAWRAVVADDMAPSLVCTEDPDGLRRALIEIIGARLAARGQSLPAALQGTNSDPGKDGS